MRSIHRIAFTITCLTIIAAIISIFVMGWDVTSEDLTNATGVILQVQATMFAIVFGFMVLSVQRSTEFYSKEIVYILLQGSGLSLTIAVYLFAIALSLFSSFWGERLPGSASDIVLFINIALIPVGATLLIRYLDNTASGITNEDLLKRLAKSVKFHDIERLVSRGGLDTHEWTSDRFITYSPMREIFDIADKALKDQDRLAADALNTILELTENYTYEQQITARKSKLGNSWKKLVKKLREIARRNNLSGRIARWLTRRLRSEAAPEVIREYLTTLFFELYKVAEVQDEQGLSLKCINGIVAATQ